MRQLFYTYVMCMGMWFIFAGAVQSHAANGGEGFYLGVYGGMAFPETFDDVKGRKDLAGASFSDLKLNSGPMIGLKFGWNGPAGDSVGRFLGIELDGSYVSSQIKAQTFVYRVRAGP